MSSELDQEVTSLDIRSALKYSCNFIKMVMEIYQNAHTIFFSIRKAIEILS